MGETFRLFSRQLTPTEQPAGRPLLAPVNLEGPAPFELEALELFLPLAAILGEKRAVPANVLRFSPKPSVHFSEVLRAVAVHIFGMAGGRLVTAGDFETNLSTVR